MTSQPLARFAEKIEMGKFEHSLLHLPGSDFDSHRECERAGSCLCPFGAFLMCAT